MSVVIEEIDGPDHTEHTGPGPNAAAEGQNVDSERFHDAGEALSDDEWQDVTEHFDGATLSQGPQDQGDRCSDSGSDSDVSFNVVESMASASREPATEDAGPSSTLPLQGGPAAQTAASTAPEQQNMDADKTETAPPPLLRPPDDFWDRIEPGRFPRGGFSFGDKWNAEGQDVAEPAAEEGTSVGVGGEETTDSGEEQPQEPEQTLTEEDIKERTAKAETLKLEGNKLFAVQQWEQAQVKYGEALDQAAPTAPQRAVYFANRAACALKLQQWSAAASDCTEAVALDDKYVKAYSRRGTAYEEADDLERALADYKRVLELDTGNAVAAAKAAKLQPIVEQRREKMKDEMIGKLKELGNTVLGKFGMSVDNFKAVKGPDGGYSLSFQQ